MMRVTVDEIFFKLRGATAVQRITEHLNVITGALSELKPLFLNVMKLCDLDVYSNEVRPWFRGDLTW